MDNKITLAEAKKWASNFVRARDWHQFQTPKDLAMDAMIEVGEILEHFRFKSDKDVKNYLKSPKNKKEVAHEMADVLFALLLLAEEVKVDLSSAFAEKLKLLDKKYPVEKVKGDNRRYTEY